MRTKAFSLIEIIASIAISAMVLMIVFGVTRNQLAHIQMLDANNSVLVALTNTTTIIEKNLANAVENSVNVEAHQLTWLDGSAELSLGGAMLINTQDAQNNATQILPIALDLAQAQVLQNNLNNANLDTYTHHVVMFEPTMQPYKVRCKDKDCSTQILEFQDKSPKVLSDRFYLSSYAKAVVFEGKTLYLVCYRPWNNQTIADGTRYILLEEVEQFLMSGETLTLCKLGLCIEKRLVW